MDKAKMERIVNRIARENHTTPEQVYQDMQEALDIGQASTDPAAQARWRTIPRKGEKVTLEEFLDYMCGIINLTQ